MVVPSDKYFPTTVSCQVHKIGSLKDKQTKELLQMFDKTIFGPLLNVNMVFNGQLIHHFLLKHIPKEANANGICFSVLGKNVRFTKKEFNIITGLWSTNVTLEKDYDNKRLQSLLFGSENKKIITCLKVEKIFKNFEFMNDHDVVEVTLAVFIETMMVGKDKKIQFDMDILGRVDDEEVWPYEVLSTASEHLATKNSKRSIPRILRWNCTQAPSYKMLQKNIFDSKNIVVKPKLKISTQEKAFMESRIRGDDNMEMDDDESIPDINNNDTNTSNDAMNNQSLEQLDSSLQLSPRRKQRQAVADQSELHTITNKKRCKSKKSNDKEQ
ncbi:Ulp1-like peptidase [Cucumis melo var. makuwa]|uniref:Ulp1-like peptidase n=1 Tax=Cucumis melo var. makuwa TaxID=1194695 RepID=A0A5D3CWM6_CUCMM|nr:Ulp1-like peptidase [Cucumis melo var. makuwa]